MGLQTAQNRSQFLPKEKPQKWLGFGFSGLFGLFTQMSHVRLYGHVVYRESLENPGGCIASFQNIALALQGKAACAGQYRSFPKSGALMQTPKLWSLNYEDTHKKRPPICGTCSLSAEGAMQKPHIPTISGKFGRSETSKATMTIILA